MKEKFIRDKVPKGSVDVNIGKLSGGKEWNEVGGVGDEGDKVAHRPAGLGGGGLEAGAIHTGRHIVV